MRMSRRTVLAGTAGALAAKSARPMRLAVCSETFAGMSFREACRAANRTGYEGIEIEPAHLSGDPAGLSAGERRELKRTISDAGLRYVGLHSVLKSPPGLHLTTADEVVRAKSWEYFGRLIELAADLGERPVVVLGSGRQRAAEGAVKSSEAVARIEEGLRRVAPAAEKRGAAILLEPLAPHLCNVLNTLAETAAIVRSIGSPAVRTMFDAHNTAAEKQSPAELLRAYFPYIGHVHLNEMDGRYPGAGDYPFQEVLQALKDLDYGGWISVEVFDFNPDGETVARKAREYLRRVEEKLR